MVLEWSYLPNFPLLLKLSERLIGVDADWAHRNRISLDGEFISNMADELKGKRASTNLESDYEIGDAIMGFISAFNRQFKWATMDTTFDVWPINKIWHRMHWYHLSYFISNISTKEFQFQLNLKEIEQNFNSMFCCFYWAYQFISSINK